jgi:hypothetical protein
MKRNLFLGKAHTSRPRQQHRLGCQRQLQLQCYAVRVVLSSYSAIVTAGAATACSLAAANNIVSATYTDSDGNPKGSGCTSVYTACSLTAASSATFRTNTTLPSTTENTLPRRMGLQSTVQKPYHQKMF